MALTCINVNTILKGNRDLSNHVDPTKWPHQEKRDKPTWTKWEKHILTVLCNGTHLKQPLGKWTDAPESKWKYRYSHQEKAMYRKEGDKWHTHDIRKSNRRSLVANNNGDQQQLPENTVPITDLEETFGGKKFTNPSIIEAKHTIETPII
eukprot:scaffold249139_cov43-Attheya_sp.AAC.1